MPPGEFLRHGRLLEPQFARQPQDLDVVAQLVDQIAALARRPAWLFQVHEAEIEGTVPLEHRDTLGLGGVRGDHGLDVEGRENGPDLVGGDPGRRGAAHHLCERAPELLVAPLDLGTAAVTHHHVLLRDAEELEPDALRLDRPRQELRAPAHIDLPPAQHRLDLRLMRVDHVEQQAEQEIGEVLGVLGAERRHGVCGHATRSRGGAPEKKALRFSMARIPIATRVSCVALPRCGSSTTFSIVSSSGLMAGSRSYTSRPAPAMVRALSAATSACSSTTSPRAVLMRNAPGFISLRRRASIRCRVSGVAGQCSDTKSASRTTSSTLGRAVAPSSPTTSGGGGTGSWNSTRIPKPSRARRATARAMRPIPTSPSVFPETLVPSRCVGRQPVQAPARTCRSPSPARRATISINMKASSAVSSVSTSGVLVTTTPRVRAAARSM